MVDAALLASLIIIPILLLFFNILVIARYVDRDGIKGHYPSLILVIILLFVAEFTVFLFPIDIGNKAGLSNLTGDPSSVTTGSIDIALLYGKAYFLRLFFCSSLLFHSQFFTMKKAMKELNLLEFENSVAVIFIKLFVFLFYMRLSLFLLQVLFLLYPLLSHLKQKLKYHLY
jgi:hypothetical protein